MKRFKIKKFKDVQDIDCNIFLEDQAILNNNHFYNHQI
jgi:hypothetical protein